MRDKRLPIKSETQLREKLDNLYEISSNSNKPFFNLVEIMKEEQTIKTAIHNIKSNKGSFTHGIDKKDINHFLQMEYGELIKIIREVIDNYKPAPVRRVWIPKSNGKKRPLGIPIILDRIIQELVRIVIEPIAEAKFFKHSYGFRPYRSAEHAIARVINIIRQSKTYYAVEGDIKSYFDNINHNKLINILWGIGIRDKRILTLVKKMLKAGIMEDGHIQKSDSGTPQGGIISPLLANIYLNSFDRLIAKEYEEHPARYSLKDYKNKGIAKVKKRHEPCFLIRYADDWIILTKTKKNAERLLLKTEKYYQHVLKIELSKEKTFITDLREQRMTFLGFDIFAEKSRLKNSIVGKAVPNPIKFHAKTANVKRKIRNIRFNTNPWDIAKEIETINMELIGISNYYKIANSAKLFSKQDSMLYHSMCKSFSKLYKGRNYREWLIPANKLDNRTDRHKDSAAERPYIEMDSVKIGLTKLSYTKCIKALNFKPEMTPYTKHGRILYEKESERKLKRARPTIYDESYMNNIVLRKLKHTGTSSDKYNFEFVLNRDYACNRDKGKCKACGRNVTSTIVHCHHINPKLPIDKVNKLNNLATLCKTCHSKIHMKELDEKDVKVYKKLSKYREIINN